MIGILGGKTMDIGRKIRDAREDLDLSQSEVAAEIPMNQSNYSKIERGIQEPSMAQLQSICRILHLDPRYLLELGDFESVTAEDMRLLRDIKKFMKQHPLK